MITKPIRNIIDQYELQRSSNGGAKAAIKQDDERKNEASKKNIYWTTRTNMRLQLPVTVMQEAVL